MNKIIEKRLAEVDKLMKDIPYQRQSLCMVDINTGDWEVSSGGKRIKQFLQESMESLLLDEDKILDVFTQERLKAKDYDGFYGKLKFDKKIAKALLALQEVKDG